MKRNDAGEILVDPEANEGITQLPFAPAHEIFNEEDMDALEEVILENQDLTGAIALPAAEAVYAKIRLVLYGGLPREVER